MAELRGIKTAAEVVDAMVILCINSKLKIFRPAQLLIQ